MADEQLVPVDDQPIPAELWPWKSSSPIPSSQHDASTSPDDAEVDSQETVECEAIVPEGPLDPIEAPRPSEPLPLPDAPRGRQSLPTTKRKIMSEAELVKKLSEDTKVKQQQVKAVLKALKVTCQIELHSVGAFRLVGIVCLKLNKKAGSPATKHRAAKAATRSVKATPTQGLKRVLNAG